MRAQSVYIQLPTQWVLGVKWLGCEVDHSPPPSAEVKNVCGAISPLCQHVFMLWYLVKLRDNYTYTFTFTFTYDKEVCKN